MRLDGDRFGLRSAPSSGSIRSHVRVRFPFIKHFHMVIYHAKLFTVHVHLNYDCIICNRVLHTSEPCVNVINICENYFDMAVHFPNWDPRAPCFKDLPSRIDKRMSEILESSFRSEELHW